MDQQKILNIIKKLYDSQNQQQLNSIVESENYSEANSFFEKLIAEEIKNDTDSLPPDAIMKRDLQYQAIEENNNSIYKALSQLEKLEENITIIYLHRSQLKSKVFSYCSLISTCLSDINQRIEKMAYLQFKQVIMRIVFEFYFQERLLSSAEVTELLKKTSLNYKALLGYETQIETASNNYIDSYSQTTFGHQVKSIDRTTRMESESYSCYRKVNQQCNQQIAEYLNEETITYLENLFHDWHLQESTKDSNSELKITSQFFRSMKEEIKKLYQKKKNEELETNPSETVEGQLDLWDYQKKLN